MLKAKEAIDILKTARNTMSKKNKRLKNFFLAFYFFFLRLDKIYQIGLVLENKKNQSCQSCHLFLKKKMQNFIINNALLEFV